MMVMVTEERVLRLLSCRPSAELPATVVAPRGWSRRCCCRARAVAGLPVGLGELRASGGMEGFQAPRTTGQLGERGHGLGGGHRSEGGRHLANRLGEERDVARE